MVKLTGLVEENGKIDITGVAKIVQGDVLDIDGREEIVLDVHEATIWTKQENSSLEIEYSFDIDSKGKRTYLVREEICNGV
ncbi:MAG: hypothetical protein KKF50_00405 [Nanoarchaeota archaeon]|nr:hypothetical protein [Nanoarchaeota archaeon]